MTKTLLTVFVLCVGLALGGCSSSQPEAATSEVHGAPAGAQPAANGRAVQPGRVQ